MAKLQNIPTRVKAGAIVPQGKAAHGMGIAGGPDEVHFITVVKLDCSYVQASVEFWLCSFPCLKIYRRAFSSPFICSSVISVVSC